MPYVIYTGIMRLLVFPRKAFRPWQYSTRNTNEQLLISPATVEMTGMLITPREEDFNKLTDKDVLSIYQQISMPLFAIPQIRVGIVKSTTIIFAFARVMATLSLFSPPSAEREPKLV